MVAEKKDIKQAFASASREAQAAFGDDSLYLERFISNARHVEVQILGDAFGNIVHLGERDCSLQRRRQKLVEEAPAPAIANDLRRQIQEAAVTFARSTRYENAGTVEFILDQDSGRFYFLEMNTRIQVEHGVSEMISGIDLVQEQFRVARGERLRFAQNEILCRGHSIECRINAEIPDENFRPNPGRITHWHVPEGPNIRIDTHCYSGYTVPMFYDSLLAKLIVYGIDRTEAIQRMRAALRQFAIGGIQTTLPFMQLLMDQPAFVSGQVNTGLVDDVLSARKSVGKRPERCGHSETKVGGA